MAAKGINVQIMAKFVGHTSFKTTLNYVINPAVNIKTNYAIISL